MSLVDLKIWRFPNGANLITLAFQNIENFPAAERKRRQRENQRDSKQEMDLHCYWSEDEGSHVSSVNNLQELILPTARQNLEVDSSLTLQ